MGLGMQLIHWDRELCEEIAGRGRVIRFDNRDTGLSDEDRRPRAAAAAHDDRAAGARPYLLEDMADDTFGLLDASGSRAPT